MRCQPDDNLSYRPVAKQVDRDRPALSMLINFINMRQRDEIAADLTEVDHQPHRFQHQAFSSGKTI